MREGEYLRVRGAFMFFKRLGRGVSISTVLVLVSLVGFAQVPASQHFVLVIDENSSFTNVTANMPWLTAEDNANGYPTNYKSDSGGLLLDYLWLDLGRH